MMCCDISFTRMLCSSSKRLTSITWSKTDLFNPKVSQRQRYEEEVGSCFEEGRVHCKRVIRDLHFPVHLQRPEKGRTTSTSRKAEESLSVAPQDDPEASTSHSQPQPNDARLNEALARVESLERETKNAMAREKRAKTTVRSLFGDLREKNLINEELKERLDFYSGGCVRWMASLA
ncbi:hypothetical protein NQZ68_013781 [Dissostichus eleginoides]|nr:hypothetical protein NQZ68_013781 [Dissostichus eleginoides]